jgi:hypothetical protein
MPVSLTATSTVPSRRWVLSAIPPPPGELDRVGEEVEQHLLDLALVADEFPKPRVQVDVQGDAVTARALPDQGDRVLHGAQC